MIIGEWKMQNEKQVDAVGTSDVASHGFTLRLSGETRTQCEMVPHFVFFNLHYLLISLFFVNVSIAVVAGGDLSGS
jgi:hypothetical protein